MPENETTGFYESDDGLSLFYREYGRDRDGTPVLCLPGLLRNSRDFIELARHLSASRRVVSPDLRGRGFSARDPEWRNYHPGTYVNDVLTLLDCLSIDRVIVIGTSLGGLIAMKLAEADASRLAGVVMNDVGPEVGREGLRRISAYAGRLPPVCDWDAAIAQTKEVYGAWLPGLDEGAWRRQAWRAYREDDDGVPRLDVDPEIGRAIRELGPQTGDPWSAFDALRQTPVLVLRGALSDVLSEEILAAMKARHPRLQAVVVPERGHVPLLDEPASLGAIDRFVASH